MEIVNFRNSSNICLFLSIEEFTNEESDYLISVQEYSDSLPVKCLRH